jgi:SAM-dependent methyltransferase
VGHPIAPFDNPPSSRDRPARLGPTRAPDHHSPNRRSAPVPGYAATGLPNAVSRRDVDNELEAFCCGSIGPVSDDRWNSNLHSFEHLMGRIPADARCGVDVGCGEGETTRRLRRRLPSVIGIDIDLASIEMARSYEDDINYVHGDFMLVDLPAASFDVVSAVAVIHHVDLCEGLTRLAALVRPGGLLLVVGLARSRSVLDLARDGRDAVSIRRHTFSKDIWETPAPKVWPPPLTYSQARTAARSVLPTATFERVGYFRYGLTWVRGSTLGTHVGD